MNFIPCAVWVKRGVAESNPQKVSVTKDELKRLIEENKEELKALGEDTATATLDDVDSGKSDEEVEEGNGNNNNNNNSRQELVTLGEEITIEQEVGARNQEMDNFDEYQLDKYDDEEASLNPLAGLAGLTLYASNEDDPYVTLKEDEDSDEDDYIIRPEDNLIVVGHVEQDMSTLEVYVYSDGHFYVHHDIMLPSLPLCLEWLDFDPDPDDNKPGNLVAVGTMSPVIEVWDVDLVDALEPAFRLGRQKKSKKKKKTDDTLGHSDAVLDLSWNRNVRNVLASGSADHTVLLWDMANGTPVTSITKHTDKVQTLEWHPFEAQTLLTGSYDSTVKVFDCRSADSSFKEWSVDGEVERVIWNHFDPFCCLASTDRGFVYCLDPRAATPVWTISAHLDACTGLSLSSQCPGCLVTVSTDKTMKVWDIQSQQPAFVAEKNLKLGQLYCLQACPDEPFTFCSGGDYSSHNFDVEDLREMSAIYSRFGNRSLQILQTGSGTASANDENTSSVAESSGTSASMEVEEAASSSAGNNVLSSPRSQGKKSFVKKKGRKAFPEKKRNPK